MRAGGAKAERIRLLPEILHVKRVPSQSTLSRFIGSFYQGSNQSGLVAERHTLNLDTTGFDSRRRPPGGPQDRLRRWRRAIKKRVGGSRGA